MPQSVLNRHKTIKTTLTAVALAIVCHAADQAPWSDIPPAQWQGLLDAELPALGRRTAATVALPAREAQRLTATTAADQPPGLYEIRLTVRPSHSADAIAFNAGLRVHLGSQQIGEWPGHGFARPHQPETRLVSAVQTKAGPLAVGLEAFADPAIAEAAWVAAKLRQGGPRIGEAMDAPADDLDLDIQLETVLVPGKAVYYVVDKIEFRPRSRSGQVVKVDIDKIRYRPGATLKGQAVLADIGGRGGRGRLDLHLEHRVGERTTVKSLPVTLAAQPLAIDFELPLPDRELGYALVAEYVSADDTDRSEAAEYFTIAANFQRVAIFGGGLATRDAVLDDDTIRRDLAKARADYFNAAEYFAWAEDDLVAMSPDSDFWSSGQTNYRMHKQTLQRQIQLAHEQGLAVSTYGKFIMSGFPGWETAYDYPYDHRGQYHYPVGMWEGINVPMLDRRRNRDYRIYGKSPNVPGNRFDTWWNEFMPINPDATPRMVRLAAEECARSVDMFGWDAIRWDGQPRGGGQCGRSGKYDQAAARRTQSLVRYFKDIVATRHPDFRHGYNYLLIEKEKGYDWAVEDFELDELCRAGGLLMNESIGNASGGWTFAAIAQNLQVEGDLCRERGGYYLGISFAASPRDVIIESALWAAAGCRPYNTAMSRAVRRYCTRYAHYTFDEKLRRLASPEKVLAPLSETHLWWQPFVYETPLFESPLPSPPGGGSADAGAAASRRQLVVNLLNLPLQDRRPPRDQEVPPKWDMPPGTAPVEFALTLPAGLRATAVNAIDPQTLAVAPLPLQDNRFQAPPVAAWTVLVIDLEVAPDAPSLASLYGPPATLGAARPGLAAEDRRPEIVLDPQADPPAVEQQFSRLLPPWIGRREKEQAELDALAPEARDQALLARRPPPEKLIADWWKGAALPADLALQNKTPEFGDLRPRRNGRIDIHYARGAMDYRLRLPAAFARLERFQVHDAPLWGAVRQSPGMHLANGLGWRHYADFDLLLFTAMPHAAIGAENSYALVDYVKAGGAVLFTGGEYAFGKGGYMHTVLERELLPLLCAETVDTVYAKPPLPFVPGPDFAELAVDLDFAARPVFWVRNQVVLKPGAKVFLQSGNHPILVGWQLGQGRVACLLVDHRGKSTDELTAFFDWPDWPKLVAAVIAWLTPDGGRHEPPPVAADAPEILRQFEAASDDELLAGLEQTDGGAGLGLGDAPGTPSTAALTGEALKQRLALINRALAVDGNPDLAAALARQLATVESLPLPTRLRIFAFLQRQRPPTAAALGQAALATGDSTLHGNGYVLLALAGAPAFAKTLAAPPPVAVDTEAIARERARDLAMAVALYPNPDLVDEGRRRVEAWNRQEETTRDAFAKVVGADTEMLVTSAPYLDGEALFERLAWLAYLSRHQPAAFAAPFARQWLLSGQYQDYCARSVHNLHQSKTLPQPVVAARVAGWRQLASRFAALAELTRPDLEALLASDPAVLATTLAEARFTPEIRTAINLLGDQDRQAVANLLAAVEQAADPDLAAFAAARRNAGP